MSAGTEIKTWEDRADAEHGFLPGDAWKTVYMLAEIAELRAALKAAKIPPDRLQNWIDVIHDNERSMGDRLQSLSSIFGGLLRGDAVDKYPLQPIREQKPDSERDAARMDRSAIYLKALAMDGEAPHCVGPVPDMPEEKASGQVYGIIDPDYGRIYTMVRKLAWEEGYAIGLHGSFTRDLDMIAVPWEGGRNCKPEKLIARIVQAAGLREAHGNPGEKPYGRKVWTLLLPEFGDPRFIDLSIMPAAQQGEEQPLPGDKP